MSAENEKIKPKTDFDLFPNYANQCVWKNLKNDSGAGANAASRLDMTFAATDPLSEIVWSPDKGLSLKCADSSFTDKKTSHFQDVGPSNMVLALPQSVTGGMSTTGKPIDDVFVKPIGVISAQSDIAASDTPTTHPTSDLGVMVGEENDAGSGANMEKMNTEEKAPNLPNDQKENLMNDCEKNICDQVNNGTAKITGIKGNKFSAISGQVDQRPFDNLLVQEDEPKPSMQQNPSPRKQYNVGIDIGIGNKAVVTDDAFCTKVEPIIEYKGSGAPGTNLTSSSRSPLEKLESTAENDLQTFNCEAACAATSGVLISKCDETENKAQDNEMMPLRGNILPALHSPCNSRIHMRINKGKEKSLSDGDANLRLSKEENDSNSSVESCNSARLFSTAKKRSNFQQQLIIGSKRVKKQIQETSGAKSYVKQDSSFMNWISNMVKGFSQSVQDDSNSLAFTPTNPDHHNLRPDQELIECNKNQDPEPKNTGFKSIFQSIYCRSLKNVGTRISHQEGEGCKDLKQGNKVHGIDATPITCCAENNGLDKQYLQSNKFEVSTRRYDAVPSLQPTIKPLNFFNSHENSKHNPVENKNCSNMGLSKDKEGMTSHSSSSRQNTNNTENVDSCALSERKEADNICHRSDTLGSLWITRFSPKSTAPLIISDHLNERGGSQVHSTDCSELPDSHKHTSLLNNCKIEETREQSDEDQMLSEAKELQNCCVNAEASTVLKDDKGNIDHKSKHKLLSVSSSSGFRNSEPVASMFARRLGAIKHITPTNKTDSTTQVYVTCLFCGTRGHQLCDCSEIAESELEDLLKNINSHGGLEELPCLCIKCFQPNHWAISCPTSISRREHELEVSGLINDCIPSGKYLSPSNEGSAGLLIGEDDQIVSGSSVNDGTDHEAERNLNLKRKSNEIIASKIECNASSKKYFGSSSEGKKLKENPMTSPFGFAERQISHVPKRIFDAVKMLRLSRTDILKWINSHESISELDGFFLRLRLGKWEEGLGGTGYHVASINEAQRQSSEKNPRKSLYVNVGGIKCRVESQYISNHDFLEEEIVEWWSTTSEVGAEIPSEEDLMGKIKKKEMLGF